MNQKFSDIPGFDTWESVELLSKGWSTDKKYIVKTKADEIVIYNTNSTKFDSEKQKVKDRWKVVESEYLLSNNLVSDKYKDEINTYDTLLISQGLNKAFSPVPLRNRAECFSCGM